MEGEGEEFSQFEFDRRCTWTVEMYLSRWNGDTRWHNYILLKLEPTFLPFFPNFQEKKLLGHSAIEGGRHNSQRLNCTKISHLIMKILVKIILDCLQKKIFLKFYPLDNFLDPKIAEKTLVQKTARF